MKRELIEVVTYLSIVDIFEDDTIHTSPIPLFQIPLVVPQRKTQFNNITFTCLLLVII